MNDRNHEAMPASILLVDDLLDNLRLLRSLLVQEGYNVRPCIQWRRATDSRGVERMNTENRDLFPILLMICLAWSLMVGSPVQALESASATPGMKFEHAFNIGGQPSYAAFQDVEGALADTK